MQTKTLDELTLDLSSWADDADVPDHVERLSKRMDAVLLPYLMGALPGEDTTLRIHWIDNGAPQCLCLDQY